MEKTKTCELLLLTSLCVPNDKELKRYLLLAQIVDSSEYKELQGRKPFKKIFDEQFSTYVLLKCDVQTLEKINKAIKVLPALLTELIFSIKKGYGSKLSSADLPDFYEAKQLEELLKKLENNSSDKNYTNITPAEFMLLFDDNTVRSAETVFMSLPFTNKGDIETTISNAYKDSKYCISCSKFEVFEKQLAEKKKRIEKKETHKKNARINRIILKFAIFMFSLLIIGTINIIGVFTGIWQFVSQMAILVLLLIYLIRG